MRLLATIVTLLGYVTSPGMSDCMFRMIGEFFAGFCVGFGLRGTVDKLLRKRKG